MKYTNIYVDVYKIKKSQSQLENHMTRGFEQEFCGISNFNPDKTFKLMIGIWKETNNMDNCRVWT